MISAIPRLFPANPPLRWAAPRVGLALALAALAEALLSERLGALGLALPVFLLALAATTLCLNPERAPRVRRMALAAGVVATLVALVEDVNLLSATLALVALALLAISNVAGRRPLYGAVMRRLAALPFVGAVWLVGDMRRVARLSRVKAHPAAVLAMLTSWILPLALLGVFLFLFALANPLIEAWLGAFDLRWLVALLSPGRILFWGVVLAMVWPFVHMRRLRAVPRRTAARAVGAGRGGGLIFSDAAVLRSLVLFNALFAAQTGMDLVYLWGGAGLPQGVTLADYAHRGAYPLMATAMLAAAFVLIAMRPGGPAARSRLVRPLVLVWIAQNVALVVSSILRLDLYVAALSLTWWRLAAFIWMGLVCIGLILIVAQIVTGRSVQWLMRMNLAALVLTLYGASLVNLPAVIAGYNVAHSAEMGGGGGKLDIWYARSLGPQAIPALDAFYHRTGMTGAISSRAVEAARVQRAQSDWRSWSFRAWRLDRYLDKQIETPPPAVSAAPTSKP